MWFFPMSGGINRHISGLTRVRNSRAVRAHIAKDPHWSTFVDTPRKWFWLPKETPWIEITGSNIGNKKQVHTVIPGTYAVVADAVHAQKQFTLKDSFSEHGQLAMRLCNYLEMRQDPHVDNFMIEQGTNKLVIIDTENFASTVGIKKAATFKGYYPWYRYLANKCIKQWFFRTKDERLQAQRTTNKLALNQLGLT